MNVSQIFSSLTMSLALVSCSAVVETPTPDTDSTIEAVQLLACPDPDVGRACEYDHVKAPEYLAGALKGDYQAQRNLAASHVSVSRWIVARPVQGCAWRMVIMVSRPADAEYADAESYRIDCSHLSPADLDASKRLAGDIYQKIHGSALPTLPAIPA